MLKLTFELLQRIKLITLKQTQLASHQQQTRLAPLLFTNVAENTIYGAPQRRAAINARDALLKEYLPWLCTTPAVTTYRLNLMRVSFDSFKARVLKLMSTLWLHPPDVFAIPELPEVICIGPAKDLPDDINQDYSVADERKEIIVDSCCAAALLRGAHLYAAGVMAMQSGTQLNAQVKIFADLSGKCKMGTSTRFESAAKVFLGTGLVRMQRHQLYAPQPTERGIAVELQHTVSRVPSLGDLSGPDCLLQNLPSIVCVRVLAPQPGECILDMCAAPGNKTTHIAEMMRDEGVLVALDKTARKVKHIHDKIAQNKWSCIRAFDFDSTKAFAGIDCEPANTDWQPPFAAATFDRILLDAPCSALGNRPLLASSMTPKMLQSFSIVQRKLFSNAVHLLRERGVLVYSTCTIAVAENEALVAWALKKFPELELVPATPMLGGPGLTHEGLTNQESLMLQRFGPSLLNRVPSVDTVGFFIAKFVKRDV